MTYQEAYDASIRIGSAMKSRGVNPVINLAFFKILYMEKNIFAINLTLCFYSTRETDVAYMGLTALNGSLQWRYDTEFGGEIAFKQLLYYVNHYHGQN